MNIINKLLGTVFAFGLLFSVLLVPATVQAQDLFPDQNVPDVNVSREGINELFIDLARLALFILPGIALIFIIFGAFKIITGGEDGGKAGWAIIKNSIIGLVIAGLSIIIVGLVTGVLEEIYTGDFLNLG